MRFFKYIFVTDFPCDETLYHALAFEKDKCMFIGMPINLKNRTIPWRKPLFYIGYLKTAWKAVHSSSENDVIISWNFNIGIFTAIIARLLFRKRVIVSLNMIAHENEGFLLKVKQLVYNWIFADLNFHFSVNQKEILNQYTRFYRIDQRRVFELHDCYGNYPSQAFSQGEGFVFCCGERRDWETYFNAARLLSSIRFVGIARKKYFDLNLLQKRPANVKMLYDASEEEFYDYLSKCAVVCIPMKSDVTAGLIVMFQSVFMNKPMVCTKTPALISTALNEDVEGALFVEKGDYHAIATHIDDLMKNVRKAQSLTENMRLAIERYSPYNFSMKILEYIHSIENKLNSDN